LFKHTAKTENRFFPASFSDILFHQGVLMFCLLWQNDAFSGAGATLVVARYCLRLCGSSISRAEMTFVLNMGDT